MSNTQLVVLSVADERSARDLASILSEIDRRDENVSIVDAAIALKDFRGKPQTIQLKQPVESSSGSLGAMFGGITSVFREKGIDEGILRKKADIMAPGQVALFVLYTGTWDKSRRALRHALNMFGIAYKDARQKTTPSPTHDDYVYRPGFAATSDQLDSGSFDSVGSDAGAEREFEGETFDSSIDWPSPGAYGEWTELEGDDPYFGEDSAGFDEEDPMFGSEPTIAGAVDAHGDYDDDFDEHEAFFRQTDDDDDFDNELDDELDGRLEADAALADSGELREEDDIALYRGLGDSPSNEDEDWLIDEVNKFDAIAEATRAALIAGAKQSAASAAHASADTGDIDTSDEARDEGEQNEALREASAGIAEQSANIRMLGSLQRETGLELVEIAAELAEFGQEVREQEMALLSAVLSNRGEKLHALAMQIVSGANSASELARTLDGASKTVEEFGVNEMYEDEAPDFVEG